jgi:superfamily I DNA/RNA helicase
MSMMIVIGIVLALFSSLTVFLWKEQNRKNNNRQLLASYLLEIQDEITDISFSTYLQKSWLYENFIDEVLEIYREDKRVLKLLTIEDAPDIFMIIKALELWLKDINTIFMENELEEYRDYFDQIESNPLSQKQREAVVVHEKNNLILAGAGSGKTSVIVAKVGYTVEKGYAKKENILVLAFNKKAQQELQERIEHKLGLNVEVKTFHAFGKMVVESAYKKKCNDFSAMISSAIEAIRNEDYISNYSYIFIDEFQDISTERNELVLALKRQNQNLNVTVVGDDWQAINSFAGSDIDIIQNFETIYGDSAILKLDYTFRFNATLSDVSQKFILKNSKQIFKNIKSIKPKNKNTLYLYEYKDKKKIDDHIEGVLQLISKNINEQKSLLILSRYSFYKSKKLDYFIGKYPMLNISFETIHGAKGLEADYVIVTHMESGKFGFPSEQSAVDLDDYPYAEERRLFYVALTRAKEKLFFIANSNKPSIFIEEISKEHELISI